MALKFIIRHVHDAILDKEYEVIDVKNGEISIGYLHSNGEIKSSPEKYPNKDTAEKAISLYNANQPSMKRFIV